MRTPTEEGQHYFCIRLSTKKDMYVYADQADVVGGSIVLRSKSGQMNFALAPGGFGNIATSPQPKMGRR